MARLSQLHISRPILLGIISILLMLLFLSGGIVQAKSVSLRLMSQPLPDFSLPSISNPQYRLTNDAFKGHVSLLNIWATWCSACQSEHALLMEIKRKYHIPIYGVLYHDQSDAAQQWLSYAGNPYVITVNDASEELAQALNLYGTPETFIIDRAGMIRYRHIGTLTKAIWVSDVLPIIQELQG